jgi:hypothetical protein
MKRYGHLRCDRCSRPAAKPPRNVCGYSIPQMCDPCLLQRAHEMEMRRRLYRNMRHQGRTA